MVEGARALTQPVEDTITAEVVRNALAVAVEEASIIVVRSSHSAWIQEGADAAAALLDRAGGLVAQSAATSLLHGASLRCSLQALLEDIPLDDMRPGDVLALNDPYRGGIHANDILVFRPIFVDQRPTWFAGTVIHVADLGGVAAGGLAALATDTFAEGVLLPPVWLHREGEPVRDMFRLLERNSRAPEKVIGDVSALVAGVNVLAARIDELVDRYGAGELDRHIRELVAYTERRMREDLRALPSGTFHGSFTIDTDGLDPDRTFEVVVAVTIDDGEVVVDFSGTDPQSGGAINSSYSQTLSGVVYAVRCFVDPSIPMNEGCFAVINPILPEGAIVNPRPPAACGGRVVTVAAAVDAVVRALSASTPERAVASSGLIHVYALSGSRDGVPWLTLGYEFGGIGGRSGSDGPDATGTFFFGGRSVIPQLEPLEAQLPYVTEWCRLVPDSGGPGAWRGGLAVEVGLRMLDAAELTVRGDRIGIPPPGTLGGASGRPGAYEVCRRDGRLDRLAYKQQGVRLDEGDVFVMRTSGGGGVGSPDARPAERVAADVADGRVTPDGARRDYGVVVDGAGSLDRDGTDRLRRERSAHEVAR